MAGQGQRRILVLGLLALLLISLTLAATAGPIVHRFVIGGGGGPVSQDGLVLHSSFGLPVTGGSISGLKLCSGFHSQACYAVQHVYLPAVMRSGP